MSKENPPEEESIDFLKIDELRYDKECLRQPLLYAEHAILAAKAQRRRDTAKNDLDLTISEVDALIRARPEKYGITEKVTESAIKAAVAQHQRVIDAQANLTAAQYRFNVRNSMVTALEHRKRSLTLLVTLHTSNYFSDPKVVAGKKERDKMDEKTQARASRMTQLQREDED